METVLSFFIVLIFSGWVLHLKMELDTLEKRMAHIIPVTLHKTVHAGAAAPAVHEKPEKPAPAARDLASHEHEPVVRKNGVRTWTIS